MSEVVYPCPEKTWESLEGESSESRFCDLCLKKVYAKQLGKEVYCGVDNSSGMSYHTFLARFAMILFFAFGTSLFSNVRAQDTNVSVQSDSTQIQELGELRGLIKDESNGEALPFATIILYQDGTQVSGAISDFDGNYRLQVAPGNYQLEVSYLGYETLNKIDLAIKQDFITVVNRSLSQDSFPMLGIVIEPPYLINDHRSTTFKRKDIKTHPD